MTNNQQMEAALEVGDFPRAIDLCVKCQQDAARYQQFVSLRGMAARFQESFERVEERLDNSLLIMCKQFDPEKYEKILIGYFSFSPSQMANLKKYINPGSSSWGKSIALRNSFNHTMRS